MRSFILLDRMMVKRYGIILGESADDVGRLLGAIKVNPGGGSAAGLFFITIPVEACGNSSLPRLYEENRLYPPKCRDYILEELPYFQTNSLPSE